MTLTSSLSVYVAVVYGALGATLVSRDILTARELGFLVASNLLVAAGAAPIAGVLVDRVGERLGIATVLAATTSAVALWQFADAFARLLVVSVIAGVGQAFASPTTNRIVASRIRNGRRGRTTGIKQSGGNLTQLVAGLALPPLALLAGWRAAVALLWLPIVTSMALVGSRAMRIPGGYPGPTAAARAPWGRSLGASEAGNVGLVPLRPLLLTGALLGGLQTCLMTYLPVYAGTRHGVGSVEAGVLVAVAGATGMIARVAMGIACDHRMSRLPEFLRAFAVLVVAALLAVLWSRTILGVWLAPIIQ